MFWDHSIALLVIFDLPLKFGSKRSTLNFWVFGPRAQFLACSQNEIKITLEDKPNVFWQIGELILSPLEEMNKTQKSFRNRRILIFQPNFVKTQFSQKSRWFSSETVEGGCDKLNKGYQNLEFFDETSNIPSPREYATLTNWRHRKPTPGAPGSHLPVKLVSLAHLRSLGGWKLEGGALGYPSHLSLPL